MFERQHASNQALTWFLRGLGWLLTVVGFNMVAGILTTLGEKEGGEETAAASTKRGWVCYGCVPPSLQWTGSHW